MVDIFDEISEDLRNERALRLAKRYGGLAIGVAILVLLGVGGQEFWQSHKAKQADAAATQYLALTQAADQTDGTLTQDQAEQTAQKLQQFAAQAPKGYKALANMRAAALYANAQETGKAAAIWTSVAADQATPAPLRDAANLLWAEHEIGQAPDADVLARLQPLALAQNSYHGLARELQGLVYLHQGNVAMAKSLFTQVQEDPGAPQGARQRAQAMLTKLNG